MNDNFLRAPVIAAIAGIFTALAIGSLFAALSASRLTLTIMAIGNIVGGGFLTGTIILASTPLAVAVAFYGLFASVEDGKR